MGVLVCRPINGVSLNGNEYLCDKNGRAIVFDDEADAREFLKKYCDTTAEDIEAEGITFQMEEGIE